MDEITNQKIVEYLRTFSQHEDSFLKEMEGYAMENHIPIIESEVAQFIRVMLQIHRPKRILEIGTAIGYSSIYMAKALPSIEEIVTIEISKPSYEIAKKNIKDVGLEDKIRVILGDAIEEIPNCRGKFDLVFIDAAKGQYIKFFNLAKEKLNTPGIILSDNVLFQGMVADPALVKRRKITIVKRLRKFLQMLNEDEEYITSIVPIDDGIAITYKGDQYWGE